MQGRAILSDGEPHEVVGNNNPRYMIILVNTDGIDETEFGLHTNKHTRTPTGACVFYGTLKSY